MDWTYFEWLCNIGLGKDAWYYNKLCKALYEFEFQYILDMDENRIIDALEMRNAYIVRHQVDHSIYENKPCSVLEMMVALSQRCCDTIMDDGSGSDYTGELFRLMLQNLGLLVWPDTHFNLEVVNQILETFVDRKYEPNGKGSLFYIPDCSLDMRTTEIWTQAMWYIESILN